MKKGYFKRFLALALAGMMVFGSVPVSDIVMQVEAAETVVASETVTGELSVSFESTYAEAGKVLEATVTKVSESDNVSYQWSVDGKEVSTERTYTPSEAELNSWIELIVSDGTNEATGKLYFSKLPVVYIDTEGGQEITSKEKYIDANLRVQGNAEFNNSEQLYNGVTEIRGRGNSTWSQPKKPYRLKLDKKTDMFGMGEGEESKHWVLLANYLDESLLRNTLAYDMSGEMGMEHLSTVWVEVVMNGEHVGNYQFCENVRVDEDRVDIFDWESFCEDAAKVVAEAEGMDDDTAGDLEGYMAEESMQWITSKTFSFNGNTYELSKYEDGILALLDDKYAVNSVDELADLITGGYILELDSYYDEVSKFKTNSNQPIMFKNPEFVYTNTDMFSYVQKYVQAFEDAVQSDDYTVEYDGNTRHYSELYDFDELIDYWLVTEIFYNEEINKKSTYMYKDVDGLMIMGPIWDMDWSSGAGGTSTGATNQWATNYFSVDAQENQWYKDLVQDPYFLMKAQERYWEIRNDQVKGMLDITEKHIDYLKESGQADYEVWLAKAGRNTSFATDSSNLKNWLNTHVAWMDGQMATEDSLAEGFFKTNSDLNLSLSDESGKAATADVEAVAPADALVGTTDDVTVNISAAGMSGDAQVFVNGKVAGDVVLSNGSAEYTVSSSFLTEPVDEKNVIEVKVKKDNVVAASNFVTVKRTDCVHSYGETWNSDEEYHWKVCVNGCEAENAKGKHSFQWVIDREATKEENGLKHEECTVCGYKRSENTEFEYVEDPSSDKEEIEYAYIPVSEMTATAGDWEQGYEAEYAIDEDESTMWHTNWNKGENHDNHWLQLELKNLYKIDGFYYMPRTTGNENGIITEYKIETSIDGNTWDLAASGKWTKDITWKEVKFDPVEARYVKLVTVSAMSSVDSIKFASAAEIRLTGSKDGEVIPPTKEIAVTFNSHYAETGKALSVTTDTTETVSYKWKVDGKQVSTSASYTPTVNDLEKWIVVEVTSASASGSAKMYCSKLPVVYIDTEGGQEITSKEKYINADIKIQGNAEFNDSNVLYDGVTEIRGRGNTTWNQPKKPYRLKLDKKTDVLGMGKSKHWVLLANYLDESLMRNTLAYDLSGSMGMEQMSTVWVDVIMNGEYIGNYQLCENIRVDDTRINIFDWEGFAEDVAAIIAKAEEMDAGDLEGYMAEESMQWITSKVFTFNGKVYKLIDYETDILKLLEEDYGHTLESVEQLSDLINGGYVLELDEYYDEVSKFKTDNNQPMMFKNPEFVNTNPEMMKFVQDYVQAFEDAVRSVDYSVNYEGEKVHYSELYDFDSLVDYWLITEIFFNEEINKKSTYMYKGVDELMKMGPIWDMDWSSGAGGTSTGATNQWATLYFSINAQAQNWYKNLVQDPYFLMKAQERYWEIREGQLKDMLDSMDVHYEYLKESGSADYETWLEKEGRKTSFDSDYNNLKTWMNAHVTWMDDQMATEDTFDSAFLSKNSSLVLTLSEASGDAFEIDTVEMAPADAVGPNDKSVRLSISGVNGTAEVFVNSKSYSKVTVGNSGTTVEIEVSALNAAVGEKNVIEVKAYDNAGNVKASNYVTLKMYEAEEDEKPDPTPDPEPEQPKDQWMLDANGWWYSYGEGGWASNCWEQIDGEWYWFGADGYMKTGWLYSQGEWYYLSASGAMVTGWLQLGSTWYYLSASGAMVTGWLQLGATWYYLNASGAMVTGWLQQGATWYYLNASGAMVTGWLQLGSTWYYLEANGAMVTGWLQLGSIWYYFKADGSMAVGKLQIANKMNSFASSGAWLGYI